MSGRARALLWAMIAVGAALRLYVAFRTYGTQFDIDSYRIVGDAIADGDPLSTYEQIRQGEISRWPYPPGYWPVILVARALATDSLPFHGLIQVVPIVADGLLALLIWHFLGRRGAGEALRLAGAGLVALGPAFAYVSGYHGHFDSVAILPAAAALVLWERPGLRRRALAAGLLIGVGAALKTVPVVMLLALLPTARSRGEAATLVGSAVAVPLLLLAPFAAVSPEALGPALRYRGVPGIGGLSVVVQPELAEGFITRRFDVLASGATEALLDYGTILLGAALLVLFVLLWKRRTPAPQAAVAVWLAVYVFGSAFAFQFADWGLPFFIMAGYLWQAALFQVALVPAQVLISQAPFEPRGYTIAYVAVMIAIYLGTLVALARVVAGIARSRVASTR